MQDNDTDSKSEAARLAYSINGFAEAADLSRSTIYAAIRTGKLKAKRRGCRTIITADAAREYFASLPDVPAPRLG